MMLESDLSFVPVYYPHASMILSGFLIIAEVSRGPHLSRLEDRQYERVECTVNPICFSLRSCPSRSCKSSEECQWMLRL